MMTDAQLKARDAGRDIGVELLQSVREMTAGQWTRKTTFEPLADGRIRAYAARVGAGPQGAQRGCAKPAQADQPRS